MFHYVHQLVANLVYLVAWCWAGSAWWIYQSSFLLRL